jgi:hypothetical protein
VVSDALSLDIVASLSSPVRVGALRLPARVI